MTCEEGLFRLLSTEKPPLKTTIPKPIWSSETAAVDIATMEPETRIEPEQYHQDVLGQKQKLDGRRGDKIHVKLIKEHLNKKRMKIHPSKKHL